MRTNVSDAIRVHVVNRYRMMISLLGSVLEQCEGFELTGISDGEIDPADLLIEGRVDVCLIDPVCGPRDGIDLTELCRARGIAPIIFLCEKGGRLVGHYLRAGARGFFCPLTTDLDEMLETIRRVHAGRLSLPEHSLDRVLLESVGNHGDSPGAALTRREIQVMCAVAEGATVSEIAARLFISEKTVGTHRANLMRKLGLRNNVALTRYAIRHGFTTL